MIQYIKGRSSILKNSRYSLNTVAKSISNKQKRGEKDAIVSRPLYLDGLATTPMDPRVFHKMAPYLTSYYGNPHSSSHFCRLEEWCNSL